MNVSYPILKIHIFFQKYFWRLKNSTNTTALLFKIFVPYTFLQLFERFSKMNITTLESCQSRPDQNKWTNIFIANCCCCVVLARSYLFVFSPPIKSEWIVFIPWISDPYCVQLGCRFTVKQQMCKAPKDLAHFFASFQHFLLQISTKQTLFHS